MDAAVVYNGVDADRFGPITAQRRAASTARRRRDRFVFLSVGGIEPRKGSVFLVRAMARSRARPIPAPALVVVGGHSFQDYRATGTRCSRACQGWDSSSVAT